MPERLVSDRWEWNNLVLSNRVNQEEWLLPCFIPFPNSQHKWREEEQWTGLSTWNGKCHFEYSNRIIQVHLLPNFWFQSGLNWLQAVLQLFSTQWWPLSGRFQSHSTQHTDKISLYSRVFFWSVIRFHSGVSCILLNFILRHLLNLFLWVFSCTYKFHSVTRWFKAHTGSPGGDLYGKVGDACYLA